MTVQPIHTDNNDDALTRLAFGIYGNPGVYALLLGSVLSRSAGIQTGWEISYSRLECPLRGAMPFCPEATLVL